MSLFSGPDWAAPSWPTSSATSSGKEHRVSVVTNGGSFFFVPSNPWVAVGWRDRKAVEVDLAPVLKARDIALHPQGAKRLHPAERRIELNDGGSLDYDYLVIATGPELAFDEIEGLGPDAQHPVDLPRRSRRSRPKAAFDALVAKPGPVVIGAVQGASCFGPAYEFAFILDTALRDAKVRDRVPMTFVTSEPYIGHLGLDGVGDTKGLLESEMREHHIKWITNARVDKVEPGKMLVEEIAEDGSGQGDARAALRLRDDAAGLPRRRGGARHRGADQSARLHRWSTSTSATRPSRTSSRVGVCVAIPPVGKTPVPVGVPKTGFMIESMVTATAAQYRRAARAARSPTRRRHLERRLPRRFRRRRHRLRRAAADPAAQRQLVVVGQVGAHRQGRLREVLPAQGPLGQVRAVLRAPRAAGARHREAEGGQGRVRAGRVILPAG